MDAHASHTVIHTGFVHNRARRCKSQHTGETRMRGRTPITVRHAVQLVAIVSICIT